VSKTSTIVAPPAGGVGGLARYMRPGLLYGVLPLAVAVMVFTLAYRVFLSNELTEAEGRLSLYRSTVVAELERFSHLTFVLARDPFVVATATGAPTETLDVRLAAFAEQAELDAIYLMTPDGLTISSSNANAPQSFVGQNYAFRPYFRDALAGRQGEFYGIGATTGLPGFFIADPVVDDEGAVVGVIALKLDLIRLENTWREAGETVVLVNQDGVVLLASDPSWRYRALAPLSTVQRAQIAEARQFDGQDLAPLDWALLGDTRAEIAGQEQIHLTTDRLPHDWVLHYFASDEPAVTRSWLAAGLAIILGGALLIAFQLRRNVQIEASLRRSEAEEVLLRRSNERLAVEIEERRAAERRLERTRDELARASRLAALGELAASVTHELGQPITAMRNHLAAAEMTDPPRSQPVGQLSGLVERMAGITRQLKFFASPGAEALEPVDLRAAMGEALTLVQPNIEAGGVPLETKLSANPVIVQGNKLRIEQVMTNLLRNALDAMEEMDDRALSVEMGVSGQTAWFEVRDRGHGLGGADLTKLQEPFVTSRASGQGMGLGLAISAGIVKEHHGRMTAENRDGGGAVFRVEMPVTEAEA
jgi:two-component system, NtrC family, C4-dicarboxylate transport sensor histidine kinase DctB